MRYLIVAAGMCAGVLLGVALLFVNPIALNQPAPVGLSGAVRTLAWEAADGFRGFPLTLSGLLGAGSGRDPPQEFLAPGIRYARAEVVLLPSDGELPPALGVRLSAIAGSNALLRARLGIVTHWNIVWPARGSALLAGSENLWRPVRDGLWSAARGRGFQPGAERYPLPPIPDMPATAFTAGTGVFEGASGAFREEFSPLDLQPGEFTGQRQLQLVLEKPAPRKP